MGIHGDFMVILESQRVGLLGKNYRVDPHRNHGKNVWFPDFPLKPIHGNRDIKGGRVR